MVTKLNEQCVKLDRYISSQIKARKKRINFYVLLLATRGEGDDWVSVQGGCVKGESKLKVMFVAEEI